jgi:hypothetical protein
MTELRIYVGQTTGTPVTTQFINLSGGRVQVRLRNSTGIALASIVFASAQEALDFCDALDAWVAPPDALPVQGVSTGYTILQRNATDRAFELDKIKRVSNGKPMYVRGYAEFVKAIGSTLKTADSHATVFAGALWKGPEPASISTIPQQFTRSLVARGRGNFDAITMHLYDDAYARGSWNLWDMAFPVINGVKTYYAGNTVREILNAAGLSQMPIVSTETGGRVSGTASEAQQALDVQHALAVRNAGLLSSLAVYCMMDDATPGFGMLRPDRTERPSFTALMNGVR